MYHFFKNGGKIYITWTFDFWTCSFCSLSPLGTSMGIRPDVQANWQSGRHSLSGPLSNPTHQQILPIHSSNWRIKYLESHPAYHVFTDTSLVQVTHSHCESLLTPSWPYSLLASQLIFWKHTSCQNVLSLMMLISISVWVRVLISGVWWPYWAFSERARKYMLPTIQHHRVQPSISSLLTGNSFGYFFSNTEKPSSHYLWYIYLLFNPRINIISELLIQIPPPLSSPPPTVINKSTH